MIPPAEHHDLATAGELPRCGEAMQVRLGAGVCEAHAVEAEAAAEERGEALLVDVGCAEAQPNIVNGGCEGLLEARVGVAVEACRHLASQVAVPGCFISFWF